MLKIGRVFQNIRGKLPLLPLRSGGVSSVMTSLLPRYAPLSPTPSAHKLVQDFSHSELSISFSLYYLCYYAIIIGPINFLRDSRLFYSLSFSCRSRSLVWEEEWPNCTVSNTKISVIIRSWRQGGGRKAISRVLYLVYKNKHRTKTTQPNLKP